MKAGTKADLGDTCPEGAGRARDKAAAAVGVSGKTGEKMVKVVDEIDRREEAKDYASANELRKKLNEESVDAAHKALTEKQLEARRKSGQKQKRQLRHAKA